MADEEANASAAEKNDEEQQKQGEGREDKEDSSSSSSTDYDSEYSSEDDSGGDDDSTEVEAEDENSPEVNYRKFMEAVESRYNRKKEEEAERDYEYHEDLFDFPRDPEKWREEDLRELWADAPLEMTKPGWDPVWADEEDWEVVRNEIKEGRDPPIAPFYLPYRKYYPAIPDNHYDISNPKSVVEELDRIEEFLKWVSVIFEDGSTYEGTVWDDLAHGKGVYVAENDLVRYEGEWLQNQMEGHGVVEVDIPDVEPVPGSKLEAKMRAEGRIIARDFMSPEDRHWLEMDIEDSMRLAGGKREIPFYERDEWVQIFGEKPEKGRYRYAGQWKHGRMHGCGVYEVNERIIYGRFYFGELLEDSTGCDSDVSALHAGIAEVAAAKARMFVNKPDGMVREERGPYGDPQHPYFYEEDDVWMAPGFINQFYDVPNYWKTYVQEIDQEREMWLNSFYKAPLRLPMPAELEYWWSREGYTEIICSESDLVSNKGQSAAAIVPSAKVEEDGRGEVGRRKVEIYENKDDTFPEFVLINKEPEPNPENPSELIYTEDPLILHTPTGAIINYVEDEKYGVRLFLQPDLKEGEDVDPEKAMFLPLGYDEFFGRSAAVEKKEGIVKSFITSIQNALKPFFSRLETWAEQKLKEREMNLKLLEKKYEFVEAELSLEEALEDFELALKRKQEEEEKLAATSKNVDESPASVENEAVSGVMEDEGDDEEEEDDDDGGTRSFGTVNKVETENNKTPKERKPGDSSFSSLSLSLSSTRPFSLVPTRVQECFRLWRNRCSSDSELSRSGKLGDVVSVHTRFCSVKFHGRIHRSANLRAVQQKQSYTGRKNCSHLNSLASALSAQTVRWSHMEMTEEKSAAIENLNILSLHALSMDALSS